MQFDELHQEWGRVSRPDRLNLITRGLKNGDLFFALSLMPNLQRYQGGEAERPIHVIATSSGHEAVAGMFGKRVGSITRSDGFRDVNLEKLLLWQRAMDRKTGLVNFPIIAHPYLFSMFVPFIGKSVNHNGALRFIDVQRHQLDIPIEYAAVHPEIEETHRLRASKEAGRFSITPGSTIVIFPYAQSLPFDAIEKLEKFAQLAMKKGFDVVSAVYGQEQPVPGTRPISIDFEWLPAFAELCGHVVALRSGVGDMLSGTSCKRVNLYHNRTLIKNDSPENFGLLDCSSNLLVDKNEDPVEFGLKLFDNLFKDRFSDPTQYCSEHILQAFRLYKGAADGAFLDSEIFFSYGRYRIGPGVILADGWFNPEVGGAWTAGYRAIMYVKVPEHLSQSLRDRAYITLNGIFALSPLFPETKMRITVNNSIHHFTGSVSNSGPQEIRLPLTPAERAVSIHRVSLDFDQPRSPHERSGGESSDRRLLSFQLRRISYHAGR